MVVDEAPYNMATESDLRQGVTRWSLQSAQVEPGVAEIIGTFMGLVIRVVVKAMVPF